VKLTSASQISKYRECARKWGWQYLAKIPQPPSGAAQLGISVDDGQLQPYLRDGREFDYSKPDGSGYIAASALAYLPPPKSPGLEVQKHFVLPAPSGQFGYQGYIDLWLPNGKHMPWEAWGDTYHGDDAPVVADFKTKSNLAYALDKDGLAVDVQAQLYAAWAMHATRAPAVDLVWINMQSRGARKVKRVHLRVHQDHVAGQFAAIDTTANAMFDVRQAAPSAPSDAPATTEYVLGLKPNWNMCEAYGGCPYFSRCNPSPSDLLSLPTAPATPATPEFPMPSTADMLANLRARAAGQAAAPAPTAPGITPTALPPPQPRPAFISETSIKPELRADYPAPAPLGINPPEAALPPAPETNAIPEPPPVVAEAPAKRGPGRPRKVTDTNPPAVETTVHAIAAKPEGGPAPLAVVVLLDAFAEALESAAKVLRSKL